MLVISAGAFPPRKHSEVGKVTAVDLKAQTITLKVCCDTEEFVWRDWTRIRIDGKKMQPEQIPLGAVVRVSYRHEVGQQALYEVRSNSGAAACSGCVAITRRDGARIRR